MKLINDYYFEVRNNFALCLPSIYCFCDQRKSFLKFSIVGLTNGAFSIFLLFLFYDILSCTLVFATSSSFILSFVLSFILQKHWTFRDVNHKNNIHQVPIYLFNVFLGLNFNGFLMHLFVFRFDLWHIFSQMIVNLIISIYNFVVYKYIIFKKR